MKVKTMCDFLGIPKGSIGEVVNEPTITSRVINIKFDCKSEPVLLQYPFESHYMKLME